MLTVYPRVCVQVIFDRDRSDAVDPPIEAYVRRVDAMDAEARYQHLLELLEWEAVQGVLGHEGVRAVQMGVKVGMGAHVHGSLWYRLDRGGEDGEVEEAEEEVARVSSVVEPMEGREEHDHEAGDDAVATNEDDAAAQEAAAVKLQSVRRGILSRRTAKMKSQERAQVN